jgi:hypothetical protein
MKRLVSIGVVLFIAFCFLGHQNSLAAIGNGVNLQPSYYNNGCVNFGWPLMEGISTVRIEIEPDKVEQAKGWIREAKANSKTIIATYHKSTVLGSDNVADLTDAANWWKTNYGALAAEGAFTVNLMNEWGSHDQTVSSFASAYNSAISTVRQVYSGTIIIDCPGWGQETHTAADASSLINDGSIMFSVHIYPAAWNSDTGTYLANSDLDYLASVSGRPCIVGEFGNWSSGSTGGADWSALVDYAKSKGWPVIAWAWNGDGSRGNMNMVTPFWADDPDATSFSTNSYFALMCDKLGNCGPAGSVSGSGNSCTSGGDGTMYVDSITCSKVRSAKNYKGQAVVIIKDDLGNPVSGATVTGTFSGSFSQTLSATTDSTGKATLTTTSAVSGTVTFSFCVDNVTHSSFTYDSNSNTETCGSYSG